MMREIAIENAIKRVKTIKNKAKTLLENEVDNKSFYRSVYSCSLFCKKWLDFINSKGEEKVSLKKLNKNLHHDISVLEEKLNLQ